MDFKDATHGVNIFGMTQYVEEINAIVLTQIASTLRNTSDIVTAVNAGWNGQAPKQFIANLNNAANKMINELQKLQQTFETELYGIQSQILDMDANIVSAE